MAPVTGKQTSPQAAAPCKGAYGGNPPQNMPENEERPYVVYAVGQRQPQSQVVLLTRTVMCYSIAGAIIALVEGILHLSIGCWWTGLLALSASALCIVTGYYGAKRKDLCLLASYAVLCAAILGYGIAVFVVNIIHLAKAGSLTDEQFAAENPWYSSKGSFIGIGVVSLVLSTIVLGFWVLSIYYPTRLCQKLKATAPSAPDVEREAHTVYGVATPGATAGYYVERQGNYSIAQPIVQGYPIHDAPPPYASYQVAEQRQF